MQVHRRQQGGTIVEAALTLAVFFFLLLGMIWFGLALSAYQSVVNAAREGARYGVAPVAATNYQLPPASKIAQHACGYLKSAVFGGVSTCTNYGGSTPPSISWCSDPALTSGSENIYVGTVQVPYTITYAGGSTAMPQQEVVVGIRKLIPIMGFTLRLTTCSTMRSENN